MLSFTGVHGYFSTGPSPGGSSQTEYQITLVLLLISALLTYWSFTSTDSEIENEILAAGEELKKLGDDYDRLAEDIHVKMKDLIEKQIDWVQHSMNEKAQNFADFLRCVLEDPSRLGGSEADVDLADAFGLFVSRWLTVFKECSNHPIEDPLTFVTSEEISACGSVSDICRLMLERLPRAPIVLIEHPQFSKALQPGQSWEELESELMKPFGLDHPEVNRTLTIDLRDGCTWFQVLGLNPYYVGTRRRRDSWIPGVQLPLELNFLLLRVLVITEAHLNQIFFFSLDFMLAVKMVHFGDMYLGTLAMIAASLLLTALCQFEHVDAQGQLTRQTAQIEIEEDDLEQRHTAIKYFFNNIDRLSDLWTYRTRPSLAILKSLQGTLTSSQWSDTAATSAFLEFVNSALADQAEQLGDLEAWVCGDGDRLSEEACKLLRRGLDDCCSVISGQDVAGILKSRTSFNIVHFAAVRIVGCMDLLPGSYFDLSDPYVKVRIGKGKDASPWQKTEAITDSLEPKWHYAGKPSEFNFNTTSNPEAPLMLEVRDYDYGGEHSLLGKAQIQFKKFPPGEWHGLHLELKEVDHGEIELEVYYAQSANQLVGVLPPTPMTPPDAENDNADTGGTPPTADKAKAADKGGSSMKASAAGAVASVAGPGAAVQMAMATR